MPSQIKIIPTSIQVPVDREKYRRSSSHSTNKTELLVDDVPAKVNGRIDDDDISSLGAPSTIVSRHQSLKKASSSQSNRRHSRKERDDDKDMMQRALEAEMVNIKLAKLLRESKKGAETAASEIRTLEKKNQALRNELDEKVEEVRVLEQQLDNEQARRMSASDIEATLRMRIAELEAENSRLRGKNSVSNTERKKSPPAAAASSGGSTGSTTTEKTVSVRTTDSSEEDQSNHTTTRRSNSRLDRRISDDSLHGSAGTLGSIFEDEDICETVDINRALETLHQLEVEDDKGRNCDSKRVDSSTTRRGSTNPNSNDILSRSLMRQSIISGRASGKRPSFNKRSSLPMVEMNPHSLEKNNPPTSRRVSFSSTNRARGIASTESDGTRRSSLPLELMQNSAPGGLDYFSSSK